MLIEGVCFEGVEGLACLLRCSSLGVAESLGLHVSPAVLEMRDD